MITAAVIRTGVANIASVLAALKRLGVTPRLSDDADVVRTSSFVVLPGVGAFAAGAEALKRLGLDDALRERIRDNRPTLAVCLGLQLLFEESEESPGVRGLGIFPGRIERFTSSLKIPQLGWNQIEANPECRSLKNGSVYFANSYCVKRPPDGAHSAMADYGEPFVAAFECGRLLACQFHPELSGTLGAEILSRWLERSVPGVEAC